eukprot:2475909-Rhodomonas_salina.1
MQRSSLRTPGLALLRARAGTSLRPRHSRTARILHVSPSERKRKKKGRRKKEKTIRVLILGGRDMTANAQCARRPLPRYNSLAKTGENGAEVRVQTRENGGGDRGIRRSWRSGRRFRAR